MNHFDWIKRHAERTPDKLALVNAYTGREYTYGQFNARANRLASFLRDELQIQPGERVGIYMRKSLDSIVSVFGILKTGAAYVPVDADAPAPRCAYIFNDCDVRAIVCEEWQSLQCGSGEAPRSWP